MPVKSKKEIQEERELNLLIEMLGSKGVEVRREKLSRGHSYRVKSGDCVFSGENLVFVDRRLPREQQLSVIIDYLFELAITPAESEIAELSPRTQALFQARQAAA